ncbi:COPII coat assembly protein SEC16 isoform X1 [Lucilia cuprina]|uniref:COPII coat assembly protein SEC16 isoform X1 n=1 Tax=Lucilia cuprina TaxID=7375 RepID=UPI001F06595E|nr:COPII coat assembly protein SEC16 isoform X1 [Lucilia cuprina]
MNSKVGSLEEKVKLPPTETISRCYQPQGNRKVIRILTVAVYVLCVSLAAIMLSLYYIFIWDPTIRPFVTKNNNCDKIVIPEKIAIRLINSSEVTAEQFYKHILEQYRILNQLQQQRQQFLQKQHIQLQQLAATGNKFQEIFATATIIQSNPKDRINKPVTPTNGTFLLDPARQPPPPPPPELAELPTLNEPERIPLGIEKETTVLRPIETLPILDTSPVYGTKRKTHRKHYQHHRRNQRNHQKLKELDEEENLEDKITEEKYKEAALNPPTSIIQEPLYTSIPIPLILNSKEDKRPHHSHGHNGHGHMEKRTKALARKRITAPSVSGYDTKSYLNPFLNGELIFEK